MWELSDNVVSRLAINTGDVETSSDEEPVYSHGFGYGMHPPLPDID
jgi:hypothetical protein